MFIILLNFYQLFGRKPHHKNKDVKTSINNLIVNLGSTINLCDDHSHRK